MLLSYFIGNAHDEATLRALNDWLAAQGARLLDSSYRAEGRVETFHWKFMIGAQEVRVFADTEAGVSVCGTAERLLQEAAMVIRMRASLGKVRCAAA